MKRGLDKLTKERRKFSSSPLRGEDRGEVSKDRLSKQHRSWNMSRIRAKNTTPEVAVRQHLHKMGYRFRLHVKIPIGTTRNSERGTRKSEKPMQRFALRVPRSAFQYVRSVSVDILLPKYKTAIFVHGCFWHRHKGCKNCTTPTHRQEFWLAKLNGNAMRDKLHQQALRKLGWRVIVIWECETNKDEMFRCIAKRLAKLQLTPPDDAPAPSNL